MKKIEKIKKVNSEEIKNVIRLLKEADKEINFFDKKVCPYSFPVKVREIVADAENFDRCSYCSKCIIRDELNGLIDIVNHWIDLYNEPKITIIYIKNNKVKNVSKSTAEELVYIGIAKILNMD